MVKISHAAGHALVTQGKQSPDGFKEWSYTNEIVKMVMAELNNYENVEQKRIDDPTGRADYPLTARINLVNNWGANVHIDYHLNAHGTGGWTSAGGTETYVYTSKPKEALELAQKIQTNLVNELNFANRGVKTSNFQMLRETKMTAVLAEIAFMTNQNEAMKMRTTEYQYKAARAIVDGLVAQYGLKKKPIPAPAPNPAPHSAQPGTLYRVQVGAFANKENADRLVGELKAKGYSAIVTQ